MAAAQMNANRDNTLLDLKELKKLVAERCRTWFSDLMVMDDEVRDRTILVKVHCMIYPISDLVVHQVFSEVGLVVDVSYISVASGFHYRVCFRDAFSANWALNYFNGRWFFEGSCRFEALMVKDVMNSHVEKTFDEFRKTRHKELPKIDEVRRQTEESVQEGEPKCFKALNQEEEVVQVKIKDAPIVTKESIGPTAHQVFDEMPMLRDKGIELLDAFPKESEVLLDGTLDQEAPPLISEVEKDDSKVFGVYKAETELADDTTDQEAPLLGSNEEQGDLKIVDSSIDEDITIGHIRALCFDPGGGSLKLRGDFLDLRCYDKELTGGEAWVLVGCPQDLGTALARKRAWKCAHVELVVKPDLFQAYWSGYGAYQLDCRVETDIRALCFDPGGETLMLGGDSHDGGALSLIQELVTREKSALWVTDEECTDMARLSMTSLFGISVNQPALVASKFDQAKAVDMKLLASLDREDLKKLCGDTFPEWISFPVYEQVKWLNKELTKLWPFVADAAELVIRESVEPVLEQYRPAGITSLKFSKLTLGTEAQKIEGIRVQSLKKNQIIMDIDFRWGGNPNIVLAVQAALVASIPIQLKDLTVFTVIRVIFQLTEEIPCISAVVVALLSEPKPRIDYTLKAVGGSLTALPGISDMIDDTDESIGTDTLQWPHRIVVQIGGIPVALSELELKPQGKLTVTIVKASDLKNKELVGKSDPFTVLYIRPLFKVKTKVIQNNLNPVWEETFDLIAEDKETQSLILEVFDEDIGQDGYAKLPLLDLESETPKEVELRLQPKLKFSHLGVDWNGASTMVFDPGGYLAEVLPNSHYDLGCSNCLNSHYETSMPDCRLLAATSTCLSEHSTLGAIGILIIFPSEIDIYCSQSDVLLFVWEIPVVRNLLSGYAYESPTLDTNEIEGHKPYLLANPSMLHPGGNYLMVVVRNLQLRECGSSYMALGMILVTIKSKEHERLPGLDCDENGKLSGPIKGSYFGFQQLVFDPGILLEVKWENGILMLCGSTTIYVFDPGGNSSMLTDKVQQVMCLTRHLGKELQYP